MVNRPKLEIVELDPYQIGIVTVEHAVSEDGNVWTIVAKKAENVGFTVKADAEKAYAERIKAMSGKKYKEPVIAVLAHLLGSSRVSVWEVEPFGITAPLLLDQAKSDFKHGNAGKAIFGLSATVRASNAAKSSGTRAKTIDAKPKVRVKPSSTMTAIAGRSIAS